MKIADTYYIHNLIGQGTFGLVYLGIHKKTKEKRAIKRLKGRAQWEQTIPLRELQTFMRLSHHENVVKLFQVYWEQGLLYFVFEYIENGSLQEFMEERHKRQMPLLETDIVPILQQVLQGLEHLHRHDCIHRDVKPENILIQGLVVKVADFTMTRTANRQSPMTSYVSTRWYRAPEVLLHDNYSFPVDIFGAACILAELTKLEPLFPGDSDLDQLHKVLKILGPPTCWPKGVELLQQYGVETSSFSVVNVGQAVRQIFPSASVALLDLLLSMLNWNPSSRLTATQCLAHEFLCPSSITTTTTSPTIPNKPSRVVSATPGHRAVLQSPPMVNPYLKK